MNNIYKLVKFDYILIKEYLKTAIYLLLIALMLTASSKSLIGGLVTAITIVSLRLTSLPFETEEKNTIEQFYGFIPVSKKQRVTGRFASIIALGIISLMVSIILQIITLTVIGVDIKFQELMIGVFISSVIYIINISLQIPAYYKYGAIKGRIISFIPLIGFSLFYFIFNKLDNYLINISKIFINSNMYFNLITIITSVFSLVIIIISLKVSNIIYDRKE